jgi:HAD superfamily hydrolase (TIGR01548 family)
MGGLSPVNLELRQVGEGIFATNRAVMQAEVTDVIVFDMDGVLIDVHDSYPVVICQAVTHYLKELGFHGEGLAIMPEETTYFKAAGGFNNDWALAQGAALVFLVKAVMAGNRDYFLLQQVSPDVLTLSRAVLQQGGGLGGLRRVLQGLVDESDFQAIERTWDPDRITRLAMEYYAGDECPQVFGIRNETIRGPGLMRRERSLVLREDLLKTPFRYGLYTGRNLGETQAAMHSAGLDGLWDDEAMITSDSGIHKPDPAGLVAIAKTLAPRLMIYAGDNLDDWQASTRYEAERSLDNPPCLFCGILGGSPGPLAYSLFLDRGVDFMAQSVRELLNWLAQRRQYTV